MHLNPSAGRVAIAKDNMLMSLAGMKQASPLLTIDGVILTNSWG